MSEALAPAAERGRLEVAERVVAKIATQVARELPTLVDVGTSGPLGLGGGAYPRASVTLRDSPHGQRARVRLDVAAGWPCRAQSLAEAVRHEVTERARAFAGIDLERLDVVLHVVTTEPERVT